MDTQNDGPWENVGSGYKYVYFWCLCWFSGGYGLGEAGNAEYSWYLERHFQLRQGWGDSVDFVENQCLEDVIS